MIKKLLLFLTVIFNSGCATKFYIKQTLDKGALACEGDSCELYSETDFFYSNYSNYTSYINGSGFSRTIYKKPLLVYIDNIKGIEYYDGLVFEVPKNLEIYEEGFYRYVDEKGVKRKVLHLVFDDKNKNDNKK